MILILTEQQKDFRFYDRSHIGLFINDINFYVLAEIQDIQVVKLDIQSVFYS